MKLPHFTRKLYGVGEQTTKIFFFFSVNLDAVLSGSTQKISPTFVKLKFETV